MKESKHQDLQPTFDQYFCGLLIVVVIVLVITSSAFF